VIALLLSMLRARRGQALTVMLLSAVATAAAGAGPVAQRAGDLAVVRNELAAAANDERTVALFASTDPSNTGEASTFDSLYARRVPPNFEVIRAGELQAFQIFPSDGKPDTHKLTRVVFRDRLCDHVVIVAGRCLSGALEIVVGEQTARRLHVNAGDRAVVQATKFDERLRAYIPDGAPSPMLVAGVYRPSDLNEPYWGEHSYFLMHDDGSMDEPIFLSRTGFDAVPHSLGSNQVDLLAGDAVFAPGNLDALKAEVDSATSDSSGDNSSALPATDLAISTKIPDLVDRIQHGRQVAGSLVPVAFVPLIVLCWFVVFLAVAYGLESRRGEMGLVSLRGTNRLRRWWLALGETSVAIVVGAPIGYLLGYAIVAVLARARLGGTQGTGLSADSVPYATVALVGALVVAFLGQRRGVAEPVVDLLRGVPARRGAWRSITAEALLVVLAVLGVLQLRFGGGLTGVALLVPGLVAAAVGLVAARLFTPIAGVVARSALRRGRLGSGLAAMQIARRPGSQRLFALLAIALGLLTFVASATGVAAAARGQRAEVLVGAPAVVAAERTEINQLLRATRAVDPQGQWAMAVQPVDQVNNGDPPVYAVDSSRLAAVATWRPEYGMSASAVADLLRPPPAQPMILTGEAFAIDIERPLPSAAAFAPEIAGEPVPLTLRFESVRTAESISPVIVVVPGRHTYTGQALGCTDGCRFEGFEFEPNPRVGQLPVIVHGLTAGVGGPDVVPAEVLGDADRWTRTTNATIRSSGGGLAMSGNGFQFGATRVAASLRDAPKALPVVTTQAQVGMLLPAQSTYAETKIVGTVRMLPKVAARGTYVDLEAFQRTATTATQSETGEIWLGPAAPADALERLRAAGLAVRPLATIAQTRADLDGSGPALALQFHVAAAGLGVVLALGGLGLVAAVDRRRRADDLRALRVQGLPRRFVRRAALWGYLSLVVGAAAAGLLAGGVAWLATGTAVPVFTDTLAQLRPPAWPALDVILVPWAAAAVAMVVAAAVAAWALRIAASSFVQKG
jgi:hypothetical protein